MSVTDRPVHRRATDPARVPALAASLAATVFGALSGLRRARVFHPHGVTVAGRLTVDPDRGLPGSDLLRPGSSTGALVRLSRAIGLPDGWPDIFGLAIKVPDAYGPGRSQDLLLTTTPPFVGGRFVLGLGLGFDSHRYSSVLPYRTGGRLHLFGAAVRHAAGHGLRTVDDVADAARTGHLRIVLRAAEPVQPWRDVATITAGRVLPDVDGEALRFDPWHTGGGIEPVGFLQRLRASAYPASQKARPDT